MRGVWVRRWRVWARFVVSGEPEPAGRRSLLLPLLGAVLVMLAVLHIVAALTVALGRVLSLGPGGVDVVAVCGS